MRRVLWTLGGVALLSLPLHAAERVNVVTDHVRSVRTVDGPAETSTLLVLVVDDAGDPIDEVGVVVIAGGRKVGFGNSDSRGRVLLSLRARGQATVSAAEAGFVPSVARGVTLRHGELTAVVLPLEEAAPEKLPEEPEDEPAPQPAGGAPPPAREPDAAAPAAPGPTPDAGSPPAAADEKTSPDSGAEPPSHGPAAPAP